jgi:aerobic carbon-monoxide dehydrogenase large subunit
MTTHSPDGSQSGLGAAVRRLEDKRLLTGEGRYADDVAVPNMAFAYVVRSPHAHARIGGIDKSAAVSAPGVIAVLTGEDVAKEHLPGIPCLSFPKSPSGGRSYCPAQPILATDKARHVGDRVALVVAETLCEAKDAAERLAIRYETLRAVTLADALALDAPRIWDEAHGNLCFQLEFGDRRVVEEQFSAAAHVTKIRVHYPRAAPNSMEPRAALASVDPTDGRFTLWSSTQNPFRVREILSQVLGIPALNIRVKAMDVGGAFGMKGQVYPEELLVVWAASKLRRPVKWTADRSESIASDMHGRHQIATAELALDGNGRVLAFRTDVAIDVGAYLSQSAGVPPHNAGVSYPGTYRVPIIHAVVRALFTNSSQLGPYRGSAKPEASFVLERLIDKAAREMGVETIELRRRNLISPSDMPYRTPGGNVYDCGNFEQVLDKAVALADWEGFAGRRVLSERRGVKRGIGLAMHCQRAGTASERMEIRVAETGAVAVYAGTLATGQGHETMFAQMIAEWLGVPLAEVRVFQGDTDQVLFGRGSFAQRSMSTGGSALKLAADEVVRKARRLSAWMMEVADADIVFERGLFRVAGTDRQVTLRDVAKKSYAGMGIPNEFGIGLDGVGTHLGPNTFPNGCIIAEVEVDPDTGEIKVDRLCAVDDAGTVVNPLTLEGQLHGSVAQGLGETLLESVVYERETGQLLTGSFMDYAMPRADNMPEIASEVAPVPTKSNLLGSKGGSEAGNVAAPAAIVNAVVDALSDWGIRDIPLPARAELVWRALRDAGSRTP